jgi:hypothetical protein
MDKKEAEQEALKKAKEVQNAAGKGSGMSGRDLVGIPFCPSCSVVLTMAHSSNIIPSGLRMKIQTERIGISRNIGRNNWRTIWQQKRNESQNYACRTATIMTVAALPERWPRSPNCTTSYLETKFGHVSIEVDQQCKFHTSVLRQDHTNQSQLFIITAIIC